MMRVVGVTIGVVSFMVGVGFGQESCQNDQCSRKPTLEDYQYMLDVSLFYYTFAGCIALLKRRLTLDIIS